MLSNHSSDTLMSYTDHSAQRHFKSNTHNSCVPKLSAHTSKCTDLESHASEVHEGPSAVHGFIRNHPLYPHSLLLTLVHSYSSLEGVNENE